MALALAARGDRSEAQVREDEIFDQLYVIPNRRRCFASWTISSGRS
jgi:hypothetical protein